MMEVKAQLGTSANGNTMKKIRFSLWVALFIFILYSCKQDNRSVQETVTEAPKKEVTIPVFNSDSAYAYVEKQVSFGPRSPNSEGHRDCKNYLVNKLGSFADQVIQQDFSAQTYRGDAFDATNIIGQFNPSNRERILLAAHWDSRFIAEEDPDESKRDEPILGADDGGSGVGVLLEIARLMKSDPIDLGVDIVFFDAEDQGERGNPNANETWCLGAQHWSRNPHSGGANAKFGILLDMVGGKNAQFSIENVRNTYEPVHAGKIDALYREVWQLAQAMGKGNYFVKTVTNPTTDDHYFVNIIRKIPMIDIINKPLDSRTSFMPNWHTHADDMDGIDKRTLRAVGQVVTAIVYKEEGGVF